MLLKHLQSLKAMNDTAGKPLYRKLDMSRIALMGHSRGGEAVGGDDSGRGAGTLAAVVCVRAAAETRVGGMPT